jgi:hypothetical protein
VFRDPELFMPNENQPTAVLFVPVEPVIAREEFPTAVDVDSFDAPLPIRNPFTEILLENVAPEADIPAANVFSPVKLLADRPASSTVFPAVSPTNIRLCVMLTANSPEVSPTGAVAPAAMLYLILIFAIVYQYVATNQ